MSLPRVAVVVTTWNRAADVQRCVEALRAQTYPAARLDVVIVDNASTDATAALLTERYRPDRIVINDTPAAHEPDFQVEDRRAGEASVNAAGFRSLIFVRNTVNLGGCGGFNTGMTVVERVLESAEDPVRYLCLVDDDAVPHAEAISRLVATAEADDTVGLVGCRSVDLHDRVTTLETTVHFCRDTGDYFDHAPPTHVRHESWTRWHNQFGGTRGVRPFTGLVETDVAAACCLLARWEAVRKLGYWDYRFFIYEDDAEWCLRFRNAGYKVLCNLDAIVYHVTWHQKFSARLKAMRLYYANRNRLWLLRKILRGEQRHRVMTAWFERLLDHADHCSRHRMSAHAELTRRAVADALEDRGGKLDLDLPRSLPLAEVIEDLGDGAMVFVCDRAECIPAAATVRDAVRRSSGGGGGRGGRPGRFTGPFIEFRRNDLPGQGQPAGDGTEIVLYSARRRSKLRRQLPLWLAPPAAVVVFDSASDLPIHTGRTTLHVDRRDLSVAAVEHTSLMERLEFGRALRRTRAAADRFLAELRDPSRADYVPPNRYG